MADTVVHMVPPVNFFPGMTVREVAGQAIDHLMEINALYPEFERQVSEFMTSLGNLRSPEKEKVFPVVAEALFFAKALRDASAIASSNLIYVLAFSLFQLAE